MKYFILAIILVLVILLNIYIQTYKDGFINVLSDINNGEGLSKEYLLHNLRLLNENVRDIQIVKNKTDGNTVATLATLKINGEDRGKISDLMEQMFKNVEYIDVKMNVP
jgi:hypothetical protein